MRRRQINAVPFTGLTFVSVSAGPRPTFVAATLVNNSYFCVKYDWALKQVVAFAATFDDFDRGQFRRDDSQHMLTQEIQALKGYALAHGATLEAVQLLGLLTPLSKEEEKSMASANNKLTRNAPATADLKAAAKAAPVKGTVAKAAAPAKNPLPAAAPAAAPAAKKKGNPEALAKARAARAAGGAVNRKYKTLKKANGGREGTWTSFMIDAIVGHPDTDSAKEAFAANPGEYGGKRLDFSWAEKQGYIQF